MKNENGVTLQDLIDNANKLELDPVNIYLITADGNPIVEVDDESMPDLWFLGDAEV